MVRLLACAVAVLAALALVAAACSDDGGDAANPVAAAVDETIDADTGRFELTAALSGLAGTDGPVDIAAEGSYTFSDRRLGGSTDLSAVFAALSGSLGLPSMFESLFDDPIDLVSDDDVLYLRFPLLAVTAGGREWVSIDASAVAGGALTIATDPALLLRFVGGVTEFEDLGEDEVNGQTTTHYSGTFTLAEAIAQAGDDERERLEEAMAALGLDADDQSQPIDFEAWVGDDDRIHAAVVGFAAGSGGIGAEVRLDLSDVGTDVDIEVPSDAVDVTEQLSGLFG